MAFKAVGFVLSEAVKKSAPNSTNHLQLRQPLRPRMLVGVESMESFEIGADLGELSGKFGVGVARWAGAVAEVFGQDLSHGFGSALAGVGGVAVEFCF